MAPFLPLFLFLLPVLETHGMRLSTRVKPLPRQQLQKRGSQTLVIEGFGYETNITMGGKQYQVLIDTGSSDLWLATNETVPGSILTEYNASLSYADDTAAGGPIRVAEVNDFLGFNIPAQAYLEVDPSASAAQALDGIIGLGPAGNSVIWRTMPESYLAVPVLDSIFMANTSTPNHLTFYLGRAGDPTDPIPGEITVGTILDEYTNITEQPKVPALQYLDSLGQPDYGHFAVYVDGIKGPDGNMMPLKTRIPQNYTSLLEVPPSDGQLLAIVDTGFTLTQVPPEMADALYSSVEGAFKESGMNIWIVPCKTEINWSIMISGVEYPIHPMDTLWDRDHSEKADPVFFGEHPDMCIAGFQELVPNVAAMPLDMILGMSFIRNAYTLINFGDFVADDLEHRGDPYMQFYSITDPEEAHNDFVVTRIGGDEANEILGAAKNSNVKSNVQSAVKKLSTLALGLIIGGVILLLLLVGLVVFCLCRRRKSSAPKTVAIVPGFGGSSGGKYQPVSGGGDEQPYYGGQTAHQMYQNGPPPTTQHVPYGDPWQKS